LGGAASRLKFIELWANAAIRRLPHYARRKFVALLNGFCERGIEIAYVAESISLLDFPNVRCEGLILEHVRNPSREISPTRMSAGGAYAPTVFVWMYATQGRYESSQVFGFSRHFLARGGDVGQLSTFPLRFCLPVGNADNNSIDKPRVRC